MRKLPDNPTWTITAPRAGDAELASRAANGDKGAFDAIVVRHREGVLRTSRAILGSRDLAEDVAQQTFIEAHKGLSGLKDGLKLVPWLMTIARRCAIRQLSKTASEPRMLEFCESVIGPLPAPRPSPALEEMGERIKTILAEMARRSREVVTLHYLDGYSCREIGVRLSIPEGTVKRILHQSRNSVREMMGVAAVKPNAKGDATKMATSKAKTKGPRGMNPWSSGEIPPPVIGTALAQSILLTANKKPMTPAQIGARINADARYVQEAIPPLVDECWVVDAGEGRYRTNFIALEADEWLELADSVPQHGPVLADAIEPHIPALEQAWSSTSLPQQGFDWDEGIWPTVAILLLNIAMQGIDYGQGEPPTRGSGHRYTLEGLERSPSVREMWISGIMERGVSGFSYVWLWCYPPGRLTLEFEMDEWQQSVGPMLAALANGARTTQEVIEQSGAEDVRVRESLARAIEAGVVAKDGDLKLMVPMLWQREWQVLGPATLKVARELDDSILAPATAGLADRLSEMGYGHLKEHVPTWRSFLRSFISGESLRVLLERGVLPDPGHPAPATFCTFASIREPELTD